jgi:acetylornithine deacetylase/succinyl-diaminopimelate desuccinylase-like protein
VTTAAVEDGTRAEIRYTAGRDNPWGGTPTELVTEHPALDVLRAVLTEVRGHEPELAGAGYWSELGVLRDALGIPGVYCAPGDIRNCHTLEERVSVEQLVAGVRAFALLIADHVGLVDDEGAAA